MAGTGNVLKYVERFFIDGSSGSGRINGSSGRGMASPCPYIWRFPREIR
jgi:hypothetical protein